jgi:hypothetical protein
VAFSADGTRVASKGMIGRRKLWDAATGQQVQSDGEEYDDATADIHVASGCTASMRGMQALATTGGAGDGALLYAGAVLLESKPFALSVRGGCVFVLGSDGSGAAFRVCAGSDALEMGHCVH